MLVLMTVALAAANFQLPRCMQYCDTIFSSQLLQLLQCNCTSITKKHRISISEKDTIIHNLDVNSSEQAGKMLSEKNASCFNVLFYILKHKGNVQTQEEYNLICRRDTYFSIGNLKPRQNNYGYDFLDKLECVLYKNKDLNFFFDSLKLHRVIVLYRFSKKLFSASLIKIFIKKIDSKFQSRKRKSYPKLKKTRTAVINPTSPDVIIENRLYGMVKEHQQIKNNKMINQGSFDKMAHEFYSNDNLRRKTVEPKALSTFFLHTNISTIIISPRLLDKYYELNSTTTPTPVHINDDVTLKKVNYFNYVFYKNQMISGKVLSPDVNKDWHLYFKESANRKTFDSEDILKLNRDKEKFLKQKLDRDIDYYVPYNQQNVTKQYKKIGNDVPLIKAPINNLNSTMRHDRGSIKSKTMAVHAKSRKTYNENEIPLHKIITKEFRNGTLLSVVNETETLPNNDFLFDYVETTGPKNH